jgi:hypothetical protein
MQPETQVKLAKAGLCPASKVTYENKDVKNLPYIEALKTSIDRGGVILDAGADADMISQVLTNYVQKMWDEELSPSQAVELATKEIQIKRKDIFKNLK